MNTKNQTNQRITKPIELAELASHVAHVVGLPWRFPNVTMPGWMESLLGAKITEIVTFSNNIVMYGVRITLTTNKYTHVVTVMWRLGENVQFVYAQIADTLEGAKTLRAYKGELSNGNLISLAIAEILRRAAIVAATAGTRRLR